MRRAQSGDAAAFGDLIDRHEATLLAVAYAVTGDAGAAADAVQDGCLRAWQRVGKLSDPDRFVAWVARIVRNAAADARRRRPRSAVPLDGVAAAHHDGDPVHDGEVRSAVDAALAGLDELTRTAVVLRYYQDMPSKQIGDVVGLSPAAVDMRLSRARAALRDVLAPHADAVPPRSRP